MCTSYKLHRILLGRTQADIARRARISVRRLSAIENAKRRPEPEERERLVRVLAQLPMKEEPEGTR